VHSTPYGRPALKRPYGHLRGGCPQNGGPVALLPPWVPHAIRAWLKEMKAAQGLEDEGGIEVMEAELLELGEFNDQGENVKKQY
jgi:hypothetical protein